MNKMAGADSKAENLDRDTIASLYARHPVRQMSTIAVKRFCPAVFPDNVVRGMVDEARPFDPLTEAGGLDIFGIEWVYVPVAMGSMENPDNPHILEDANDWREVVKFPDVRSWDWAGSAKENNGTFLTPNTYNQAWIMTGWFERLISFMGFEEALIALVDEDQQDAVQELFMALSDTYIEIVDCMLEHYENIDSFYIHDDWGSQAAPLFNFEAGELIVPAMRKLTDYIHSRGKTAELHSCGCCGLLQTPNFIAAGFDMWCPQAMNDIEKMWELYGDKILLPVPIDDRMLEDVSDEEQAALAREHVAKYCGVPGKPSFLIRYDAPKMKPAFMAELLARSTEAYAQ